MVKISILLFLFFLLKHQKRIKKVIADIVKTIKHDKVTINIPKLNREMDTSRTVNNMPKDKNKYENIVFLFFTIRWLYFISLNSETTI